MRRGAVGGDGGGSRQCTGGGGHGERRHSGEVPAKRKEAPRRERCREADGGNEGGGAPSAETLEAAGHLRPAATKTRIPASSRGEERNGWRRWVEEERGLTVLPFIGRGEAGVERSCAETWRRRLRRVGEPVHGERGTWASGGG